MKPRTLALLAATLLPAALVVPAIGRSLAPTAPRMALTVEASAATPSVRVASADDDGWFGLGGGDDDADDHGPAHDVCLRTPDTAATGCADTAAPAATGTAAPAATATASPPANGLFASGAKPVVVSN